MLNPSIDTKPISYDFNHDILDWIDNYEIESDLGKYVLDKRRSSNLLKGYQTVRKLSEREKRNLNTLCRGSALRYLLTRSYDYLNTPKNAIIKIKDPREYIDKLNFHRNLSSFKDYS
mgnify:CR=1 FL=1